MQTVTMTFVQATFVLVTFVHINNNLPITDPILTKLFVSNFETETETFRYELKLHILFVAMGQM